MFHYLFTNDLRISNLENALTEAAKCYENDCVPSASEDKSANNNMNSLGFYFNLTKNSNCTKECVNGNVRKVVLNFIKKFQFPNPRTPQSLKDCIDDGIRLAPMRVILKTLYLMTMICPEQAYLTNKEIAYNIFFNEKIAKSNAPDLISLIKEIVSYRVRDKDSDIPSDEGLKLMGFHWNDCKRQVREMVKVLCWSGCATKDNDNNSIKIYHDNLSRDNEADLFETLTYSDFWNPDSNKSTEENKESYQRYMDVNSAVVSNVQSLRDDILNHNLYGINMSTLKYSTGILNHIPRNRIIFGAPGTGKSYTLNQQRIKLLGTDNETDYERVTFHPDYSYANFVGTYKPVMVERKYNNQDDSDVKDVISILRDENKTAQEKYNLLYDRFQEEGLTRLPILLGLYTDEPFKTRKQDGSDTVGDNSVERNHGRAIRKYIDFATDLERSKDIAYEYVPGPFMRVYVNALKSARTKSPKPYLLIIEEINRANVAAVFGDVFQLLDRGDDGVSEYPIQATEDIKKYLAKELGGTPENYSKIKIPDNMFIWATMNSADQGVFPIDTAFKRRWEFTYLGIDDNDKDIRGKFVVLGKDKQHIEWNELRKAINEFLADNKVNEDKQLGPYFISRNIVVPSDGGSEIDSEKFCNVFKNKVLMYLFDDAAKQKRAKMFEGSIRGQNRYSRICEAFDEQGIGIFSQEIQSKVRCDIPM